MSEEAAASPRFYGTVISEGRPAYHSDGFLYCPGQGVFHVCAKRQRQEDGSYRTLYTVMREAILPPSTGWLQLPTWIESVRGSDA